MDIEDLKELQKKILALQKNPSPFAPFPPGLSKEFINLYEAGYRKGSLDTELLIIKFFQQLQTK